MAVIAEFEVLVVRAGPSAVVQVCGELDLATAPRLRDQLAALVSEGGLEITVDLAELDFIDSTGLNVLISTLKAVRANGGDLALHAPTASTRRVLELTGLTGVVRVTDGHEGLGRLLPEPGGFAVTGG